MEPWLIGMKFLLLGCVMTAFALRGGEGVTPVVLLALVFSSASVLSHLLKPRAARLALQALSVAAAAAGFFAVDAGFAVLIPLVAAELAYELTGVLWLILVPALFVMVFVGREQFASYALSAGFGLIAFAFLSRYTARLETAERENERLRASNESLLAGAVRSAEYEDEIAYLSQLEERNRLAQEIHDRVGHAIAGGMIQLEAASALLERDREGARAMMDNSVNALRDGMESIRRTLRGIKPAREELGIHRLKTMLDEFAAASAIATRLSYGGDLSAIGQPQWKAILDTIRECLTNTARHSSAKETRVRIDVMNRIVKVEAKDDGRGNYSIKRGLGLTGIEERTAAIGGKVILDGSKGFSVIMLLPREEGGTADAR
jgi:signal transduction histidine kinase